MLIGETQLNDLIRFEHDTLENIEKLSKDAEVKKISQKWIDKTGTYKYAYNWRWLGLPIIQLPADIVGTQEIIWRVQPTIIVETGVARGGSILFNASQLALLDLCDSGSAQLGVTKRRCIGIDIDIRRHNREAIESHPLAALVTLIEGSSTADSTLEAVRSLIRPDDRVLVILDSNHTHDHVLSELKKYSPLVSLGSYLIVHDTGIENAPPELFNNRNWGTGNSPLSALKEFLRSNSNFEIDKKFCDKLLLTSSPEGYVRRLS
jgi:cephalosporin hydroxylase